jgi:glutathione S-transferase
MKLFHSPASPFVRKVMVLAHETGLLGSIERIRAVANPVNRDAAVVAHNPAGHVPTLLLVDGTALYDSTVICQYLDTLHEGTPLLPAAPLPRARTLCLQALADGMLNACVLMRYESALRPEAQRWPAWYEGQQAKVRSSLDVLERQWMGPLNGAMDLGVIATACALGYLDFRFPDEPWREGRDALARWYEGFSRRPSMQATWPDPNI